jgi:hypothetical protein
MQGDSYRPFYRGWTSYIIFSYCDINDKYQTFEEKKTKGIAPITLAKVHIGIYTYDIKVRKANWIYYISIAIRDAIIMDCKLKIIRLKSEFGKTEIIVIHD